MIHVYIGIFYNDLDGIGSTTVKTASLVNPNKVELVDFTTMTLDPNYDYLCIAHVQGNKSSPDYYGIVFFNNASEAAFGGNMARATLYAGGGLYCFNILKSTKNISNLSLTLRLISYSSISDLTFNAVVAAIKISKSR